MLGKLVNHYVFSQKTHFYYKISLNFKILSRMYSRMTRIYWKIIDSINDNFVIEVSNDNTYDVTPITVIIMMAETTRVVFGWIVKKFRSMT